MPAADAAARIDDLDRSIVERLRINGRESNRSLAAALGVNEATIAARLRRLEAERLVHVVALTDMAGFGYQHLAFAMIVTHGRPVMEVATELTAIPQTIFVNVVTGRCDIICGVLVQDLAALGQVVGELVPAVAGVARVDCELAIDVLRFDSEWAAIGAADASAMTGPPLPPDAVDRLDRRIIDILQRDARTSNRAIAQQLDASERTVRVRLKRMEDERLIRMRAVSDVAAFDRGAAAVVGVHARAGAVARLGTELANFDCVAAVLRSVGRYDYLVVVAGEDRPRLLELVLDRMSALDDLAAREIFEIAGTLKHVYTWARLLPTDDAHALPSPSP